MKAFTPHPYQVRGMQLLCSQPGAGLLLDPGMGKTSTVLGAFVALKDAGLVDTMLVVAPIKPMYDTWPDETQKWEEFSHLTVSVVHGPGKEDALYDYTDITIINPEGLKWLFNRPEGCIPKWDVLCIDESTKFKNASSQRFKLLKKQLPKFDRSWILTGTITPNGLMDLFSQVYIMDQGLSLGKFVTKFKQKYFYQSGYGGYTFTPKEHAVEDVSKAINHMVLKLDAEDWLDMPELINVNRYIKLPDHVMRKYKKVETEFILQLSTGTIMAANAAAAGTKCRQIANGACYDLENQWLHMHDKKLEALEEIQEETNGLPLFILYEYRHDKERLLTHLGDNAVCITGMKGKSLSNTIAKFNRGEIPYLIAHPRQHTWAKYPGVLSPHGVVWHTLESRALHPSGVASL